MNILNKFLKKSFSSTKESFKKIVEYSEMDSLFYKNEKRLYETLCLYIEKQNNKGFNEILDIYEKHNIKLSSEEINKLLSYISFHKMSFNSYERINNFSTDKDIDLDSLSYSYLINSFLKNKGFSYGYSLFFKAKLNQIKVDLSVYYNLIHNLEKIKINKDFFENSKNFLIHCYKKDFDNETIKILDKYVSNIGDRTSRKSKNKDTAKPYDQEMNSFSNTNDFKKISNNIIIVSESKGTPLYSEFKNDFHKNNYQSNEKPISYKDFHKISKKIRLKELNFEEKDLLFEKRLNMLQEYEEIIKELKIDKNTKIDYNKFNKKDLAKLEKLKKIYEELKEKNGDKALSLDLIDPSFLNVTLIDFLEMEMKKLLQKSNEDNNSGDD